MKCHLTRICAFKPCAQICRGGVIIKQMREQSGAHIKVLSPEELPACALSNDRVVQCASGPLPDCNELVPKAGHESSCGLLR